MYSNDTSPISKEFICDFVWIFILYISLLLAIIWTKTWFNVYLCCCSSFSSLKSILCIWIWGRGFSSLIITFWFSSSLPSYFSEFFMLLRFSGTCNSTIAVNIYFRSKLLKFSIYFMILTIYTTRFWKLKAWRECWGLRCRTFRTTETHLIQLI